MADLRNCTPTVRVGRTQTQIALTAAFPECSVVLFSGVEDAVDHAAEVLALGILASSKDRIVNPPRPNKWTGLPSVY